MVYVVRETWGDRLSGSSRLISWIGVGRFWKIGTCTFFPRLKSKIRGTLGALFLWTFGLTFAPLRRCDIALTSTWSRPATPGQQERNSRCPAVLPVDDFHLPKGGGVVPSRIRVSHGEHALEGVAKIVGGDCSHFTGSEESPNKSRKPDIWHGSQPEFGKSDPAEQSSELDIWRQFQPEASRSDPARLS